MIFSTESLTLNAGEVNTQGPFAKLNTTYSAESVVTGTATTVSVRKFTCHGVSPAVLLLIVHPAHGLPPARKTATMFSQLTGQCSFNFSVLYIPLNSQKVADVRRKHKIYFF